MAKSNRPTSPGSTLTTTSIKSRPDGRKYTTRVEKSKPKYSFRVETQTVTQTAIPDEIELDGKHFKTWPGILKLMQLVSTLSAYPLVTEIQIFQSHLISQSNSDYSINCTPLMKKNAVRCRIVHAILLSTINLVHQNTLCRCRIMFRHNNIRLPILPIYTKASSLSHMAVAENCKSRTEKTIAMMSKATDLNTDPKLNISSNSIFAGVFLYQFSGSIVSSIIGVASHLHKQGGIQDFTGLLRLLSRLSSCWGK